MYRHDDRHYGYFIIEDIGLNDGLSIETLRSSALEGIAEQAGVTAAQIPVLQVTAVTVDGIDAETMVYGGRVDGLTFVYANTMVLTRDTTLQALTHSVGTEFTDKHQDLHNRFLEDIRLNIEQVTQ